jgi:hypothetical protein
MGKVLIVFRGEHMRKKNGHFLDCRKVIPNNKKRVLESIQNMGHEITVWFCTYDSEYLNDFKVAYNCSECFLQDYHTSSQHKNFKFVLDSIEPVHKEFDKIIILRFDYLYKKNFSDFNWWDKEGIVFPFKDNDPVSYEERKYCFEGFILITKEWFQPFLELYLQNYIEWKEITYGLHFLTTLLFKNGAIPYHYMEGDTCWISNTSLAHPTCKNPYFINLLYTYYHDDYSLVEI